MANGGRAATEDDVPAVAACLASAFFEDPVWGHWTFPDANTRARDLVPFMTLMAELGLGESSTDMTRAAEAITIWTPPGASYVPREDERRLEEMLAKVAGSRAPAIQELLEEMDERAPTGSFYHLEWWATHRDHAGRGLGTALLRENLARVDGEHLPSYLESTNPANIPRYEALGFGAVEEFGPAGGPTITTMWREAH
jgi:GNAT superfamily N-acetyltransferase